MTTQDYLDAIIPILRQRPDGMHIQDIIASLIGSGLVSPDDEKEHHRIQSIVSQKSKKKDSPFAHVINKKTKKPAKGMYKIRPVASSANKSKQRAIEPIQTPDVSTSYTGAGGEFLIMSELLFQGYNVNKMTVDDGEDIIATKNGKFYYFQIKTSYLDSNGCASFTIKRSRYELYKESREMYYTFVVRGSQKFNNKIIPTHRYITLNNSIMEHFVKSGLISITPNSIIVKIKFISTEPILYNNGKEEKIELYQDTLI